MLDSTVARHRRLAVKAAMVQLSLSPTTQHRQKRANGLVSWLLFEKV